MSNVDIVLVLVWLCSVTVCVVHGATRIQTFVRGANMRFINITDTLTSASVLGCSRECMASGDCGAVNYKRSGNVCEIVNLSTEGAPDMVSEVGWDIFYMYKNGCLQGWQLYDNSCYHVHAESQPMNKAKIYCSSHGAHVVDIKTTEEDTFVKSILAANTVETAWLGALYDASTFQYVWDDGTVFSYSAWYPGEPSNLTENCVFAWDAGGYMWYDVLCSGSMTAVICEYPLV